MSKKIPWLVVSCLMVLSLILASCAPTAPPEEEEVVVEEVVVEEEEEVVEEEVVAVEKEYVVDALGRRVEKPRYGGTLICCMGDTLQGFDEAHGVCGWYWTQKMTNESLMIGDWVDGSAGRNKTDWIPMCFPAMETLEPQLAENWERPEENTLVFYIRKGIHFSPPDKAPTYGREMTADDVAFSLKRLFQTDTCYVYHAYPWDIYLESITAESWEGSDAKYTVVLRSKPGKSRFVFEMITNFAGRVVPRDAVEYYGDLGDWENAIGTGPFWLVDYVPDASIKLVRNPNYWKEHPLYPGMEMPFLDAVKILVIPDRSTRLAGLRSGKIDTHNDSVPRAIEWEDKTELEQHNPDLQFVAVAGSAPAMWYRCDNPELPIYDVNVRKALNMAVDQYEINDTYYGGEAEILAWPVMPYQLYKDSGAYVSLEELPESNREIFEYHPDKARQLLADAGYPDGFKTEVCCFQAQIDLLSIVKNKWQEVLNVDLQINVSEYSVWQSIGTRKTYPEMYMAEAQDSKFWYKFMMTTPGNKLNYCMVDDPVIEEKRVQVIDAGWEPLKQAEIIRELMPHMLDLNLLMQFPSPVVYNAWQPWVRDYHGERTVGYIVSYFNWPQWVWYDQDMKYEMIGKR